MNILITTLNSKYSHTNIAGYYLKNSLTKIANLNIQVKQYTINDDLNNIVEDIIKRKLDLICFGCYIWNIEQTLKIITTIHLLNPNIKIALGGPEVSYNPSEIFNKYPFITSIMCGEGEISIQKLVMDIIQNKTILKIYTETVTMQDIPDITEDIINNYDNRVVYFETSRGCPYRCSYCLSCIDKHIKYFDLESCKTNLKKLLDLNVKQIRFLDRTFNSNKARALNLWKFLVKNRKDTTFHFEICANLLDEKTLNYLKTIPKNIFQFEIGIQSTNKITLQAINRNYNFDNEKLILKRLHKMNNIKLHTDLIIGLPFETLKIFKNSFNELYYLHPTQIQLGFLKLLKGTDIYANINKYNYKFSDYPPYEVLENKFITFEEIRYLKKFETIFERLYNSLYFKNTLKVLDSIYNLPYELYEDIVNYFIQLNLFSRNISTDELFDKLNCFFIYKFKNNSKIYTILNQALTYDYFLKFNGKRDWFYQTKLQIPDTKKLLNNYILINKEKLFDNKSNNNIYKNYKFIILDYNFLTNKKDINHIYFSKKN